MMMPLLSTAAVGLILSLPVAEQCYGLSTPPSMKTTPSRRQALQFLGTTGASVILGGSSFMNVANAVDTPNRMDVENFLSTGMVAQPMGVSGQVCVRSSQWQGFAVFFCTDILSVNLNNFFLHYVTLHYT